jgi:hypothetical protein
MLGPRRRLTRTGSSAIVVHVRATRISLEAFVRLRFLGIYPNTPDDGSPTIWLDEGTGDLVIQSYKADAATLLACQEIGSVPGHSTDVPGHETVIRLPANMLQFLPRVGAEVGHDHGDS